MEFTINDIWNRNFTEHTVEHEPIRYKEEDEEQESSKVLKSERFPLSYSQLLAFGLCIVSTPLMGDYKHEREAEYIVDQKDKPIKGWAEKHLGTKKLQNCPSVVSIYGERVKDRGKLKIILMRKRLGGKVIIFKKIFDVDM